MLDLNPVRFSRYLRKLTRNSPRARAERALARRLQRARAALMRDIRCKTRVVAHERLFRQITKQQALGYVPPLWKEKDRLEWRLNAMAERGLITTEGFNAWNG